MVVDVISRRCTVERALSFNTPASQTLKIERFDSYANAFVMVVVSTSQFSYHSKVEFSLLYFARKFHLLLVAVANRLM